MSCGHCCRRCFSKCLCSKTLLSKWVLFWVVLLLWAFFNSGKYTHVNYTLQLGKSLVSNFQQPMLLPVKGRWCKHISWLYLALPCARITLVHISAEGRFLENLLYAVQIKGNFFYKIKFRCLIYQVMWFSIILFHIFSLILTCIQSFKWTQ